MARVRDARTTRAGSHPRRGRAPSGRRRHGPRVRHARVRDGGGAGAARPGRAARRGALTRGRRPVSYTHLTLPTICSV
eukprot:3162308-Prymnesium_polylepis.1